MGTRCQTGCRNEVCAYFQEVMAVEKQKHHQSYSKVKELDPLRSASLRMLLPV